jgi:hypothetical protein
MAGDGMDKLTKAIEHLLDKSSLRQTAISGCTAEEVTAFERAHAVRLPVAYRTFLRYLGKGAGPMFLGSDFHFQGLSGIRDLAEHVTMNDDLTDRVVLLPDDAFAFMEHQGYQIWFFRLTEGDDPPVYYYLEDHPPILKQSATFTDFILSEMRSIWHLPTEFG